MTEAMLHVVESEDYIDMATDLIRRETARKKVIYVTATRPYHNLVELLKRARIPADRIFFIDCISTAAMRRRAGEPTNCVFLEHPAKLSEICHAILEAIRCVPGRKTVIFDSLSTLLAYVDARSAGRFSHFLCDTIRGEDVDVVILTFAHDLGKDIVQTVGRFARLVTAKAEVVRR